MNNLPDYVLYLLITVVIILFIAVIVLVTIIYKLKSKETNESIHTRLETTNCKYHRHPSNETAEIELTPQIERDRFKLGRQDSLMAIVNYPSTYDFNESKQEEINSSQKLQKVLKVPQMQVSRFQMKAICQGVLDSQQKLKTQHKSDFVSLLDLNKIMDDKSDIEPGLASAPVDKCASSPMLDAYDTLAPPETNTDAGKSSPTNFNFKNIDELKLKDETDGLIKVDINKDVGIIQEEIYDSTPNNNPVLNDDDDDEVYDNLPNVNRPVSKSNLVNVEVEDVYDNPPCFSRPVLNSRSEELLIDEVYDNPPTEKRPVNGNVIVDELYEVLDETKANRSTHLLKKNKDETAFITDDETTGYILKVSTEKNGIGSYYVNANLKV